MDRIGLNGLNGLDGLNKIVWIGDVFYESFLPSQNNDLVHVYHGFDTGEKAYHR